MADPQDRLAALPAAKRALLEKLFAASAAAAASPAPPAPIPRVPDGPAPLSAEQRRLWYLLQLAPGHPIYTLSLGLRLRGAVDTDALAAALRELVSRHETLRTAFRESAGEPVQEVIPAEEAPFALETLDLRGDEWAEAEANYQTGAFARRLFDLAAGETFRALLVRETGEESRLLLGIHHLAADGASAGVLLGELSALYAARAGGASPPALPAPPVRFRDWAAWQRRPDAAAPRAADEAFWRAGLAGAPPALEIPTDRPRPPMQAWEGAKHPFAIPAPLAAALRALARRERTTPYTVVAAAFALLLSRLAGEDELLLGTLLANRPRAELEGVVGFFTNTVPLRIRLHGDPAVGELLRRVHRTVLDAHEHAALPFDRVVELAGARRDFSRPPLVQAVLTYVESPASALALPGVRAEPLLMDGGTSIFDLTLQVEEHGGALDAFLQYPESLFDAATVDRMARHLVVVLAALAAADHALPVSRIPLADDEEARTAAAWSAGEPAAPESADACIHTLFERQAAATPHATAIVHGGAEVTYAALDARAACIARGLRARGVGPETRVGVVMERTPALVAALLGILKVGGAYVPLDPAHPPARHEAALRLSRARLVLADAASRARLDGLAPAVEVLDPGTLDGGSDAPPAPLAAPENLAYVIFTSGSTGGPKGVEVEHRAAAALLAWARGLLDDEERAAVLASTPVVFDVSVGELFGTLCAGGTLVLVENALAAPPPGRPVLAAAMTPTAASELLREGRLPPGLSTLLLAGETLPPALAAALHEAPGLRRVLNLYGPTEDTVYSTCALLEPGEPRVPIGRPAAGGRVHVLDAALRPAGIGVPGEVWTAGAGVARGYASRPALTAERFLPDPHGPPGSRMYRTLDRGRWREDGALEHLGRADAQVKVRGHRIELEEVEQALAAHPCVALAAADARGETGGGRRLVAWLVPREGAERPSPAQLRAWVRERLPEAMVPGAWAWTDALPRTPSGKLDRRALPDPEGGSGSHRPPHVEPRTPPEARLAALWRELLGVERVGVHDDFFDLGGQSILATRLAARLRDEAGASLSVAELVQAPTLEAMARRLEAGQGGAVRLPLVALQTFGPRPPLFLAHPAGGHVVCYRGLAVHLAPEQPVLALQPRGVEDGRAPLESVEAMAAHYVDAVRAFRPAGPYRLGGWSFGGVIAWEMACLLAEMGEEVELLALVDTAPHTPDAIRIDPRDPAEVIWHTVAGLAGWPAASRVAVEELRGLAPRDAALHMVRRMEAPLLLPESRVDEVLALTAVRAANLRAQQVYRPRVYPGRLTYFRVTGSAAARGGSPGLAFWSALALGGTDEHPVTGSHGAILQEPHVFWVAEVLRSFG